MIRINLKLSGIAAAAGFILSLLVGIASGGGFFISLLRALAWGVVFFGLSYAVWVMINRFLPELLISPFAAGEDDPLPEETTGSRVDISLDDGDEIVPEGAVTPEEAGAENDLDNISDLLTEDSAPFAGSAPVSADQDRFPWEPAAPEDLNSGSPDAGMDQNNKESYTKGGIDSFSGKGVSPDFILSPLPRPLETSGPGDGGIESLPDLDAMAGAFMSSEDAEEEDAAVVYPAERKPPDSKGKSMGGNLNSRELASAIQNILKKG
ncbi:hypothetical protein FACS189450_04540 [Spirochaetia bacterium]|nr:hypothetical protein FACS189450_04540 [Spirochaetia bacterium]